MEEAKKILRKQVFSNLEVAVKEYESTNRLGPIKKFLGQSVHLAYLIFYEEYHNSETFKDPFAQKEPSPKIIDYEKARCLYQQNLAGNKISKKYLTNVIKFFELIDYSKEAAILSEFYLKLE